MSEQEKSATQQRIDNAVYGTPKIKPDEQRKYLGTFRERVCLTISVQELQEQDWTKALTAEIKKGIGNLVFINGNLPHNKIRPYIQTATHDNAQFTLKTDPEYKTDPSSLAVVIAAKTAVYQSPVDVKKRYPELTNASSESQTAENTHHGFFHQLFHRKERR
ncbi:YueI family protein [Limosilactobacillus sp. STM2_1]|uniref:YueI family protein n=1 Tax=Limosilactobacillus rudii TaxID=2759755 RepID=A0A7W3YP52_9LACO|nr:YueI family protein [Limosilactobacillus rudii]MBB1079904.1 YueI family protein [Limosilactobacillus rudii]MBB1097982.1 YueI family protein [Limosilactobacillus rudii]MCD7135051.1 YueI family protein [Limosilactobacillus rudii]